MKVKELIELLEVCGPDLGVYFEYEYHIEGVPYESLNELTHVEERTPYTVCLS